MNNCVNNWGGLWQLLEMEKSMLSQICCLHVWPFCEVTRKAAGFDGGGVGGFSYSLWVASFGILLAEWVQRSFSSYIAIAAVSGSLNIWSNNPLNDQNKSIVVHCNNRLAATPTPTPLHAWLAILDTTRARWKHVADNKRLTKRLGEYSGWIHSIQNVPIFCWCNQKLEKTRKPYRKSDLQLWLEIDSKTRKCMIFSDVLRRPRRLLLKPWPSLSLPAAAGDSTKNENGKKYPAR